MNNNVSAVLNDEDQTKILQLIAEIKKLLPFGIKLTPAERASMAKIDDARLPFVEKSLQFGKQEPMIVPPYADLDELDKDVNLYKSMDRVDYEINSLAEMINDTRTGAGNDAYVTALSIYNSAKGAVKMGIPGTESIADELKGHFIVKPSKQKQMDD